LSAWGIVFDLGGVLLRVRPTWDEVGAALDLPQPDRPWGPLGAFAPLEAYQSGRLTWPEYVVSLAAFLHVTPAVAVQAHAAILGELYEGVEPFLTELQKEGIPTVILSNTNAAHAEVFTDAARFPALTRVDRLLMSHELGVSKPDPACFAHASAIFAPGTQVVFFDDAPVNVATARELGWEAHVIDPAGDPIWQMRETLAPRRQANDPRP
jgi:putative hydrolase of the HAD superfamily